MTLRLTIQQYATLVRCLYVSKNVIDNADLDTEVPSTDIRELWDAVQHVAPDFDAESLYVPDSSSKNPRLNPQEETLLNAIIDNYDDGVFWDILEERLASRDITDQSTESQWNWLPETEKIVLYNKIRNYYFDEFSNYGIQNLKINHEAEKKFPADWYPLYGNHELENLKPDQENKIIQFPANKKTTSKKNKPENPEE